MLLADDPSRVEIANEREPSVPLRLARQSVMAGLGLSALGMIAAGLGWLPPVAGAVVQEAIDVRRDSQRPPCKRRPSIGSRLASMTSETSTLQEPLIILLAAVAVVPLVRRFQASAVLGYLAAGALIGPYGFALRTRNSIRWGFLTRRV